MKKTKRDGTCAAIQPGTNARCRLPHGHKPPHLPVVTDVRRPDLDDDSDVERCAGCGLRASQCSGTRCRG